MSPRYGFAFTSPEEASGRAITIAYQPHGGMDDPRPLPFAIRCGDGKSLCRRVTQPTCNPPLKASIASPFARWRGIGCRMGHPAIASAVADHVAQNDSTEGGGAVRQGCARDGPPPTPDDTVMILRAPTMPPLDIVPRWPADYRAGPAVTIMPLSGLRIRPMTGFPDRLTGEMPSQRKTPRSGAYSAKS